MKSSKYDLRNRGYIEDMDIDKSCLVGNPDLFEIIESKKAYVRTLAIRLLSKDNNINKLEFHKLILDILVREKSLYTKIEICNVLDRGGDETLIEMFKYVGRIGKNQHKELPKAVSKKNSYPLPRDIIARTIGKMNISVLSTLLKELNECDVIEARELVDAIGFLCFYNKEADNEIAIKELINCYEKYKEDNIIRWKIVMSFSAFNNKTVISKLKEIIKIESIDIVKKEAERSLNLIK
ncbi:HEAT repeat domain-containing protein [Clostridium gasigenes]|uniref:HEAT repeat-containing protein n=1 Tax=Clostridium gasigenes TaxID=94869 RepID=A0A1H0R5J2_9CLOT|nr:HEAT repeat domain-containing protein [Clostridium gasigenes]MBB6622936.1 HEAT repeat domain-containing protein [Clostridium gasigenes]MBU3087706.1 HEAT repeat domain-containing protein [Clostridium gasigenes]SDP24710.1 hypothetical protein SAMN04488529_10336 [Clostridium gasigenes]